MPEWWLLNSKTQEQISVFINNAARRVIDRYDSHYTENGLTGALGQELSREGLQLSDTSVVFFYRKFGERREEPATGADGGFLVTIKTQTDEVTKAVLFQAKKLPQDRPTSSLSLQTAEASRLRNQIDTMLKFTPESIVLTYTRQDIYALDALKLGDETIKRLRYPFKCTRPLKLGTYLGKWVARCTRGDTDDDVVSKLRKPGGFINHLIEMNVQSQQKLLLADGDSEAVIEPSATNKIPKPIWRP